VSRRVYYGHGSDARARRHYRDGEKPCPACRDARNQAHTRRRNRRRQATGYDPDGYPDTTAAPDPDEQAAAAIDEVFAEARWAYDQYGGPVDSYS